MSFPDSSETAPGTDYRYNERKECRNTTIYCTLSIALLIAAGAVNNPLIMDSIPGGQVGMTILSIGIVVGVLILCAWQAPRRP